jgi:hypothetical protein
LPFFRYFSSDFSESSGAQRADTLQLNSSTAAANQKAIRTPDKTADGVHLDSTKRTAVSLPAVENWKPPNVRLNTNQSRLIILSSNFII